VTYEGVTLGGKVGFADYLVGYLTRQKERASETFVPIGEAAGVRGNGAGLILAGVRLQPIHGLKIEISNQIVVNDVFNTAFGQLDYAHAFDRNFILTVAGQYTDQRAVGDALLGGSKFKHWAGSASRRARAPLAPPSARTRRTFASTISAWIIVRRSTVACTDSGSRRSPESSISRGRIGLSTRSG